MLPLIDDETRYWQEEYRKGNLDDVDMPGEIRALLDGTAESLFADTFRIFACFLGWVIPVAIAGWFQGHRPDLYAQWQDWLRYMNVDLGTGWDPMLFVMFGFGVLATVTYFITGRKRK